VQPTPYSIVVEGALSPRYAAAFDSMQLEPGRDTTAIVGMVEDEAELRGLLDAVAALGLSLVSVTPVVDSTPT
jgi:hypothetical protein